jgi:hypothetical protein
MSKFLKKEDFLNNNFYIESDGNIYLFDFQSSLTSASPYNLICFGEKKNLSQNCIDISSDFPCFDFATYFNEKKLLVLLCLNSVDITFLVFGEHVQIHKNKLESVPKKIIISVTRQCKKKGLLLGLGLRIPKTLISYCGSRIGKTSLLIEFNVFFEKVFNFQSKSVVEDSTLKILKKMSNRRGSALVSPRVRVVAGKVKLSRGK